MKTNILDLLKDHPDLYQQGRAALAEAFRIVEETLSEHQLEYKVAREALLLLEGKIGPMRLFEDEADKS